MSVLAVVLILLSQWFGWASWRRILENRLRPRMLFGQMLCSGAQLCLLTWGAFMDGLFASNDYLANPSGGFLAYVGAFLQLAGLWLLCWLTSGLVLSWHRQGAHDRKSLALTLTVALLSHLLLTVLGPVSALDWVASNFR